MDPQITTRPIHTVSASPARLAGASRGATLIELVIAIVIFAAVGAAIVSVYVQTTAASVDPQIRAQGRSIAEAYMDEILLQEYCQDAEPDATNPCDDEDTGGGDEGQSRSEFDDVYDYDSIGNESPPQDQLGNPINQLDDYTVSVDVVGDPQAGDVAEITVTVEHSSGKLDYDLVSERALY